MTRLTLSLLAVSLAAYAVHSKLSERLQVARERKEQCSTEYERNVRCLIVRISHEQ